MNKEKLDQLLLNIDNLYCDRKNPTVRDSAKALVLHLGTESYEEFEIPSSWLSGYVAGPALAARIWACFVGQNADSPLDYELSNPIVIVSSPSAGKSLPMGESMAVAFKSPQTGKLALNVCTSSFGARLQNCGYEALVVLERFRRLGSVHIDSKTVDFRLSDRFFGKMISECESSMGKNESGIGSGCAGDNHIVFGAGCSDGKITGRGGLGYVFGMKNLKAIVAEAPIKSTIEEKESVKKLRERIENSPNYNLLKKCGTSMFVNAANKEGWAPIYNYSKRTDPRVFHFSGSEVSRKYQSESSSCFGCAVKCCHKNNKNESIPGFDSLFMLGSNCGCFDVEKIISRYNLCVELGLDPVSVGNILGFLCMAQDEKKSSLRKTVDFSDNDKVLQLISDIGNNEGLGEVLGHGVEYTGRVFDFSERAIQINGLECQATDFRGSAVSALNAACERWFFNYFGLEPGLTNGHEAFWQVFSEELVMGLECFGFSPSVLLTELGYVNERNKFFISHSETLATLFFRLKAVTDALSEFYSKKIKIRDIRRTGALCRYLIDSINDCIRKTPAGIPDYFVTEPDSNRNDKTLVRINSLLDRYFSRRNLSFAVKFPDGNKS